MPISPLKKGPKTGPNIVLIHAGLTLLVTLAAMQLIAGVNLVNFLVGQGYNWLSLLSLSLSVYLFFLKKNIALLIGVIVFKWPILIYVVYRVTETVELRPVFLALGFLPLIFSFLIWSLLQKE